MKKLISITTAIIFYSFTLLNSVPATIDSSIRTTSSLDTEKLSNLTSVEVKAADKGNTCAVYQIGNPYYAQFDNNDNYQIKKTNTLTLKNNEIYGATTLVANALGYSTIQNDKAKTITYKNSVEQFTYKNGSKVVQKKDLISKKTTNISTNNAFVYSKDKNKCNGSEKPFLSKVGGNAWQIYGHNLSSEFKSYLQTKVEGENYVNPSEIIFALKSIEPHSDYKFTPDIQNAFNKYNVVPITIDKDTVVCIPKSLHSETKKNLDSNTKLHDISYRTGLTDSQISKTLGFDKYKNDPSVIMVYAANSATDRSKDVVFKKDSFNNVKGWQTINGQQTEVRINSSGQVENMTPEQVTQAEKSIVFKEILKYSADKFQTEDKFTQPIEKMGSQIILCYSSTENQSAERSLACKLSGFLKSGDVVNFYGKDNNLCAYVFDENSILKYQTKSIVRCFDINGNIKEICDPHNDKSEETRTACSPSITFDKELGIVLSVFDKSMYRYDGNKFNFLNEYKMYGTERQRMVKSMRMMKEYSNAYSKSIKSEDIDIYERTGSTDGCESIVVFDVGETSPWIIRNNSYQEMGNPKGEFTNDQVKAIGEAMKWLHAYDPGALSRCVNRSGGYFVEPVDGADRFNAVFRKCNNVGTVSLNIGGYSSKLQVFSDLLPFLFKVELDYGMYYQDFEYKKNGKTVLDPQIRNELVVKTNSLGLAKSAAALRWAERLNGTTDFYQFDQAKDITQSDMKILEDKYRSSIIFPTFYRYSLNIQLARGAYNNYRQYVFTNCQPIDY